MNLWKIPNNLDNILKKYDGKIITRFPPEPSAPGLHIGHAKALLINYIIAKKYNGQLILRFDDTNPSKESVLYENGIISDVTTLGITPDKITHTSDYFEQIIDFATYLLVNNLAYVDDSSQEIISEYREKKLDTISRSNSVETNIELWNLMKIGVKQNACVRIKINMQHKNSACRDPAIFRYINKSHHNTKDKYKVYPMYDFACPIVDVIENVTHVFRSTEFSDRDEQYNIILDYLKLHKPYLGSYGKLNFVNAVMGKRKINELIQNKIVSSWDDPRLLTIRGIFNKGLHLEALHEFIAKMGFSKNVINMTEEMLWKTNKKYIDNISTRYMVVPIDSIQYRIDGLIDITKKEIFKYIKNPDYGKRLMYLSNTILLKKEDILTFVDKEEITLINWTNMIVDSTSSKLTLHTEGDFKTTEKKILWLSDNHKILVKITTFTTLYEEPITTSHYGEQDMLTLTKGDYVQLMKMNYYICTNIDLENQILHLTELPK